MPGAVTEARASEAGATIDTEPATTARGTVLVLPGRGDTPAYYRRLSARLAADGYRVRVAADTVSSVEDVVAVSAAGNDALAVVIGVDTSAGLLATALADGLVAPAGAVFAGTAVPGGERPAGEEEVAARSACPVFRGLTESETAEAFVDSAVEPVWPGAAPRPAAGARVPVLVLHGEADALAPLADVLPLVDDWDAEVVTVRGGLHDVLNDVHHRSVAAEIVTFLERLRAGGSDVLNRRSAR
jgi:pimeloyl-ACP methyl ester carboxylesterase